jgi:hypothetical protein
MNRNREWRTVAVALAAGLAIGPRAVADNEKGTAVIKGKVVFDGAPPKTAALKMSGDQHCAKAHDKPQPDQGTIVYTKEGNAVPYSFVYLKKGVKGKYTPPPTPVEIDQEGCMYHPHVFGMVAGQQLNIKNSDPTSHNIHSLASKNPQFNFLQPNKGMVKELKGNETFTREEVMAKIKCDVHAWMSSYVGVLTHPFFSVTKSHENDGGDSSKRGTFEITAVPAGEYVVEAWHERFGAVTQTVTVKDGETKEVVFKMGPGAKAEAPTISREVILSTEVGTADGTAKGPK